MSLSELNFIWFFRILKGNKFASLLMELISFYLKGLEFKLWNLSFSLLQVYQKTKECNKKYCKLGIGTKPPDSPQHLKPKSINVNISLFHSLKIRKVGNYFILLTEK